MIVSKKRATELLNKALDGFTPEQTLKLFTKIQTADAMINSQVGKGSDIITTGRITWEKWININNWANYFANRWKYDTPEMRHMIAINWALRTGYIFGDSGVWNNNGTPEIINITKYDLNYAYFTLSPKDNKSLKDMANLYDPNSKPTKGLIKRPKNEVVAYQFDSLGYGAIMILEPVLKFEKYIQKSLFNEAVSLPTRLLRVTTNPDVSNEALKQFIELNSPVITKYAGTGETYEGIRIDTNTDQLLNLMEGGKNWYYDILGRRTNSDFKLSHTLEQEAQNSAANVDAIEWDRWLFFKNFIQNYAKLFNIKIKIENFNGVLVDCFSPLEIEKESNNETLTPTTDG